MVVGNEYVDSRLLYKPCHGFRKIVAVILPVSGMIIFPLFTVYLTDYVTRAVKKASKEDQESE